LLLLLLLLLLLCCSCHSSACPTCCWCVKALLALALCTQYPVAAAASAAFNMT
jgi:hypothetical protein